MSRKKGPLKINTSVWKPGFRAKLSRKAVVFACLAEARNAAVQHGYQGIKINYK